MFFFRFFPPFLLILGSIRFLFKSDDRWARRRLREGGFQRCIRLSKRMRGDTKKMVITHLDDGKGWVGVFSVSFSFFFFSFILGPSASLSGEATSCCRLLLSAALFSFPRLNDSPCHARHSGGVSYACTYDLSNFKGQSFDAVLFVFPCRVLFVLGLGFLFSPSFLFFPFFSFFPPLISLFHFFLTPPCLDLRSRLSMSLSVCAVTTATSDIR